MNHLKLRLDQHARTRPITHYGIEMSVRKGIVFDKNINVLVKELDVKENEKKAI